jgi:type II secretory pathway predicted ATPase ExeA
MIEKHFGLKHSPFAGTVHSECYFAGASHEAALSALGHGQRDQGVMLLTGEPGLGKTFIAQRFLEQLGTSVTTLSLTNGHLRDRVSLLQAILFELGLPFDLVGEETLRLAATEELLKRFAGGTSVLISVDEAHHLNSDLLEELRLLTNLEGPAGRALQVLLVGQPSIVDTIEQPELACLSQRLLVRPALAAMPRDEALAYVCVRLKGAGAVPARIMTAEALEIIAEAGKGVPRLLNQAAARAMETACEVRATTVDAEIALAAIETIPSLSPSQPMPAPRGRRSGARTRSAEEASKQPGRLIAPPRQSA